MSRADSQAVPVGGPTSRAAPPPFPGFRSPNYTPVPDELFDELLVELSGAELKVLLYIIRRTFGFKRESDTISLSQMLTGIQTREGRVLDRGVGLSKKTLLLALRSLEEREIILTERRQSAEKGNEPTVYQLNVLATHEWPTTPEPDPISSPKLPPDQPHQAKSTPPLGEKVHQGGGGKSTPSPRGKNYTTQYREEQETVEQDRGEQETASSTGFELVASTRQERERSAFSKETRQVASARRAEFAASSGSASEMTTVGMIAERRRQPAPADPTSDDGHAPERPTRPRRRVARAEGGPGVAVAVSEAQRTSPHPMQSTAMAAASDRGVDEERRGEHPRRTPPPRLSPYLEDLVIRYSEELHDEDHIPQNLGQAGRLWKASGWSEIALGQALTEAKAITLKRDIKKRASVGGEYGTRNKMPYFFKVLRDLLGLKGSGEPKQKTGT